jgi:hypothetical protein
MESVTSSRPERSGFPLQWTGIMTILHGLRGRIREAFCSFPSGPAS